MLAPRGKLATSTAKKAPAKEWAHMVDVDKELTDFHELVPNMAREARFSMEYCSMVLLTPKTVAV